MKTRVITYRQALCEALSEEMQRNKKIVLLGEDIAIYGGAFGVTKGLLERFGKERLINTPISENSFTGAAVGMAMMGMHPVVEIMFMDFITLACDQIINHAAKLPFIYSGQVKMPLLVRTPIGAGRGYGASHSQSLERLFMGVPGIKMVSPFSAYEAKGLLKSALRTDELVLFIEHKMLYSREAEVPEEEYLLDLSKAAVLRPGKDLTLISYSKMLEDCLELAEELSAEIDIEVIDLRSLRPVDLKTISDSVKKTGRVVLVEEGPTTGGICAEVAAEIAENCLEYLDARVVRVGAREYPIPSSRHLEDAVIPDKPRIERAIRKVLG